MFDKAVIRYAALGREATVEIDGVDIARGLHATRIELRAGHLPVLHLEAFVNEVVVEAEDGFAEMLMSDDARNALIASGWTPPESRVPVDVTGGGIRSRDVAVEYEGYQD